MLVVDSQFFRVRGFGPGDLAHKVLGVHQWNIEFYRDGLCSSVQEKFIVGHVCAVELVTLCPCVSLPLDFWIWKSRHKLFASGYLGS